MAGKNRYERLIEAIFFHHYEPGCTRFTFEREELERFAAELNIRLPKNLGDVVYTFRYRSELPVRVSETCLKGMTWYIFPAGKGRYRFEMQPEVDLQPNPNYGKIKLPDATPGIIASYALSDEQALLAKLRYNRLLDIFTRITCYSLQNHLRTAVVDMGQVETDELYVGMDRSGTQYILPVQAKGGRDKLNIVQILQDMAMCAQKFPNLVCRPIAAQFIRDDSIAMFEFADTEEGVRVVCERHYRLVPPDEISPEELGRYKQMRDE
ncbi:MAG TPA: endonuclease [Phycisphaerales bacterium]|nr:endonuclease [Phycisphaerales bacterium]